jgi:hypothetical protein
LFPGRDGKALSGFQESCDKCYGGSGRAYTRAGFAGELQIHRNNTLPPDFVKNRSENIPTIMKQEALEPTWVLFIASGDEHLLRRVVQRRIGRVSHYHVEDVASVVGEAPVELVPGWRVVRIESEVPLQLSEESRSVGGGPFNTFRGVTEHLHYTGVTQHHELNARSHAELNHQVRPRLS